MPATPEFVQILKTGSHWVYLSTILTTPGTGTVKIFDSTNQKPNSIAVEHARRMLIYPGCKVSFTNGKVQRQVLFFFLKILIMFKTISSKWT